MEEGIVTIMVILLVIALMLSVNVFVGDSSNCVEESDKSKINHSKENRYDEIQEKKKNIESITTHNNTTELNSNMQDNIEIDHIYLYNSYNEYRKLYPERALEIELLGIDLSTKDKQDLSEWVFAIETTARDSNCRISELKKKYFESLEKNNPTDADWIYYIRNATEFSKSESKKYNLKLGNTAGDMVFLFLVDKIKEIEAKYVNAPIITKSSSEEIQMRFMLDGDDDVLFLQKLYIYLRKYPMTEKARIYRENCHDKIMTLIEKRIAQFENIKDQPLAYNMAISTEIFRIVHNELYETVTQSVLDEFNSHLLSFHEEMEIISNIALEKFRI